MADQPSSSTVVPESAEESPPRPPEPPRPSMLDVLRCPQRSELTRKRAVGCNPAQPSAKRKSSSGRGAFDPKSIKPSQRVSEFPRESFSVSAGKLFCMACREEVAVKRGVVTNHIQSTKHQDAKDKLEKKEAREHDIVIALKRNDATVHPKGEMVPDAQRVYRVKVVWTFLRAAVPLNKLDLFRDLLEEHAFRLTDRRHNMSDIISFIHDQEQDQIKAEISGQDVSVIFDGTTRSGEALAIIVCFIDESWSIQQRLVRLQLLVKSLSGEEVARELICTLSTEYGIKHTSLLAAMRDRASVNNVAMRTLMVVYPSVLDVGCFAHTLDHVGEKFATPLLSEFITAWISLFSHSPRARFIWREQTGLSVKGYSSTRWWSKWEVIKQVLEMYGDVEVFLHTNTDLAPATHMKLLVIFDDVQKKLVLG